MRYRIQTFTLIGILASTLFFRAQNRSNVVSIVPFPAEMEVGKGNFVFSPGVKIFNVHASLLPDIQWFNAQLESYYGYTLEIVSNIPKEQRYIELNFPDFEAGRKEKYDLNISEKKISILAEGNGSGFFYAFQTLLQLLPVQEVNVFKVPPQTVFTLPNLQIKDSPRFSWRGMHLDVCRHYFPPAFIKKYLDIMAMYKLNTFHWHLTEDQGWRIEIKKYPLLIQKGSVRKGTMIGKYSDGKYDSIPYGGYYTQEEIKDIVNYAKKLHINVVPEIEMPGHSLAAISAYPWLSCTGQPQEVAKGWGVFEDVYCTKDSTFQFLRDVMDEVCELFPSAYIHIGGDECPKTRWKQCRNCQTLMKGQGLKSEEELQSYFIQRMEKYLNSKGKQIIGWDEILEGGLAPNAAVMSWRGTRGGIAAAQQKHSVVMSPGKPCYFDHHQSKDTNEPLAIGGYNPVDSVYAYDPTPKELSEEERSYILGAQGNVWTEYILNEKQVEYMAIPRMCALAEAVWTPKEKKDLESFRKRLQQNSRKLDRKNVNYAKHFLLSK